MSVYDDAEMTELPFGIEGRIEGPPIPELSEKYTLDDMTIELRGNTFRAGYNDPSQQQPAERLVRISIDALATVHNTRLHPAFDRAWSMNLQGQTQYTVELAATIASSGGLQGRVQVTGQRSAPASVELARSVDTPVMALVQKAEKDPALREALRYFNEEVLDSKRPLYGVYKALEILTGSLGGGKKGRIALGKLARVDKLYVDKIMETTQQQRHATTSARCHFTEEECKAGAKMLIEAYADLI
jgi:hypothetical protein